MFTPTSMFTRSILAVATVGSLAMLADGTLQSQRERAVTGDLSFMGRAPAPVRVGYHLAGFHD